VRARLAWGALALTIAAALAFAIPLALLTGQHARDRALAQAGVTASTVQAYLALAEDRPALQAALAAADPDGRVTIHLPDGTRLGRQSTMDAVEVRAAAGSRIVPNGDDLRYLQPGGEAVIEVLVPSAELTDGVAAAWWTIALFVALLVGGSVALADRLGVRVLAEVEALSQLLRDRADTEREHAADLSHRLRTPLTALQLDADALPPGPYAERMRDAISALDAEIDAIIAGARRTTAQRAEEETDVVDVLADRLAFWAVLAEDHGRPWVVVGQEHELRVRVPRADVIAAVDALLGNVFRHTPEGAGFRVTVSPRTLVVEDEGPGIDDPQAALTRGASGAGSSGLGLDIVQRVAAQAGGSIHLDHGALGGARVTVTFAPAG
jgi:signal transduction histidine kinase